MLKRRQHRSALLVWRGGPTGVIERGECSRGVPRNLGDPVVSSDEDGGQPEKPRPAGVAFHVGGSE
jgi:hypothetical protein